MRPHIKKLFQNKEDGIAILFSLGVLCLIIITLLVFISVNSIERKAAFNYNSLQFARVEALSLLERARLGVKMYASDYSMDVSNLYSYDSAAAADTGLLWGKDGYLSVTVNGVQDYVDTATINSIAPTWQYIHSNNANPLSPVIGRFAYRIIAVSNKIDPSACIDSGTNYVPGKNKAVSEDGGGSSDSRDGKEYTSLCPDGASYVVGRPGRDISEIFLRCMDDDDVWINANNGGKYTKKISSTNATPNGQLDGSRWGDVETLLNALNVQDPTIKDKFKQYFVFDNQPDPEAFWYDVNNDRVKQTAELYDRFNLARTDWNSLDTSAILDTSKITQYGSSGTTNGYSIPWIANWDFTADTGNFTTAAARRAQIAANLIDYSDTDDTATTDGKGDGSGTAGNNKYTYAGLEKCPYINEVRVRFEGTLALASHSPYYDMTRTITPVVDVEVVDLYGSGMDTVATVYVSYQFNWSVGYGYVDTNKKLSDTVTVSLDGVSKGYICDSGRGVTDTRTQYTASTSSSLDGIIINSLSVKLSKKSTGEFLDFAYIVNPGITSARAMRIFNSAKPALGGSPLSATAYADFQINDPRQNLNYSDWGTNGTWDGARISEGTVSGVMSALISGVNSVCNPFPKNGNTDTEPYAAASATAPIKDATPWDVSTAYIRNAPMQSPWELGMIHRGTKWQTINLKKFNPAKGVGSALKSGGGKYTDGDANVLDQIKMTSNSQTYGKIDLNSTLDSGVFKALFERIRVGSDISSSEGPGTLNPKSGYSMGLVDNVSPEYKSSTLARAVQYAAIANTDSIFHSRAEVLSTYPDVYNNTKSLWDDSIFGFIGIQNCDATQEEIIGKFINLTKAENNSNIYTVVIIAEAIKDITPETADNPAGTFVDGKDKKLAQQKIIATLRRDATTGKVAVLTMQYGD